MLPFVMILSKPHLMQRTVGLLSAQTWWSEPELTLPFLAMLLCRKRYKVQVETDSKSVVGWQQAYLSRVMGGVLNYSVHLAFPANA